MPSLSSLFSNLFLRQRISVEVDAVPASDEYSDDLRSIPNSSSMVALPSTSTLLPEQNMLESSEPTYNTNQHVPSQNNILALNHTQGQVVYQFAHINGLHLGSVYNINNNQDSPESQDKRGQRTRTIQAMMKSEEQLSAIMMDTISTHLGDGWKRVMRVLKFSDGQIHQAVEDNRDGGIKEAIYQLLLEWSRNCDDASLGKITRVLWKTGHEETVHIMKETRKKEMKT